MLDAVIIPQEGFLRPLVDCAAGTPQHERVHVARRVGTASGSDQNVCGGESVRMTVQLREGNGEHCGSM